MKRELREVLRQLEDLERALRDEEMRVLSLGREIKELSSRLDRLDGEKREAEHQAMTSRHLLQQLDSEMTRVGERLSVAQLELQRLAPNAPSRKAFFAPGSRKSKFWNCSACNSNSRSRSAQESLSRSASAPRGVCPDDLSARGPRRHSGRAPSFGSSRFSNGLNRYSRKWDQRVHAFGLANRSGGAEKLQREDRKRAVRREHAADLEAERNAGQTREGLLQFETEQLRARLTGNR